MGFRSIRLPFLSTIKNERIAGGRNMNESEVMAAMEAGMVEKRKALEPPDFKPDAKKYNVV